MFFSMTTVTKKVISRVLDLRLDQALRLSKANSNTYKVMSREV